jgi:diaminopimelate epimerase
MSDIAFVKAHGIGNDFVLIPDLDDHLEIPPDAVRRLCDRRFGVGADGVIRIVRAGDLFFMDYRNADGSLAEMCGNGIRTVGKWLGDEGLAAESVDVDTRAGVKTLALQRTDGVVTTVRVDMGPPQFADASTEHLRIEDGSDVEFSAISMGNPHAVIFVDDVDAAPLHVLGPMVQANAQRFPEGVNVEVAAVAADGSIDERTFERGVGETLACGTAACAVAVAAQRRGFAGEHVEMRLRGGVLTLDWTPGGSVFMTGAAEESFRGTIDAAPYGIAIKR